MTDSNRRLAIAIGTKPVPGAYGGGTRFARCLVSYLTSRGHQVYTDLSQARLDLILLTEPRWRRPSASFEAGAAFSYRRRYPTTRIIQRLNECDERKGRNSGWHNRLLRLSGQQADAVVFVSEWLKRLHTQNQPGRWPPAVVIANAADPRVFNPRAAIRWSGRGPLKIVTHHWSDNWFKGWDVYQRLDRLLSGPLKGRVTFTFIGRPWPGAKLRQTCLIKPLTGLALARALKQHHVYLTASQYEPGPMHVAEARQCGLPIIYRRSGSLPEYCRQLGPAITGPDQLLPAIKSMMANYDRYRSVVLTNHYQADQMSRLYLRFFQAVKSRRLPANRWLNARLRFNQSVLWLSSVVA